MSVLLATVAVRPARPNHQPFSGLWKFEQKHPVHRRGKNFFVDCDACALKARFCPKQLARKILRDVREEAAIWRGS
jgi:hypothetical protein